MVFRCDGCGKTFEKAWSEAEREAEYQRVFAGSACATATVCDDCYSRIMLFAKITGLYPSS